MAAEIKIGTKIWRQVGFVNRKPVILDLYYRLDDREGAIIRAEPSKNTFCTDVEAWVAIPSVCHGFLCFCQKEIPEDTIGFEVTRVNVDGTSVQVKPITGSPNELKSKFEPRQV